MVKTFLLCAFVILPSVSFAQEKAALKGSRRTSRITSQPTPNTNWKRPTFDQSGFCEPDSISVIQVANAKNARIRIGGIEYWFTGKTAGFVDGKIFSPNLVFKLDGTQRYQSNGGPRTVRRVRLATAAEIKTRAEARKKAEANAKTGYAKAFTGAVVDRVKLANGTVIIKKAKLIGIADDGRLVFESKSKAIRVLPQFLHRSTATKISDQLSAAADVLAATRIQSSKVIKLPAAGDLRNAGPIGREIQVSIKKKTG